MTEPATGRPTASPHYDAAYFEWQQTCGYLGGWANVDKYRDSIRPGSKILDFGCGGGFLLANLECAEKFGVKPNATARETAAKNGGRVFVSPSEALEALGPESVDVIVSDNALEPWRELLALRPLLKRGGRLHIVVPCENISCGYKAKNIDQHVYSWSPQSIGNLVKAAGFDVEYSRPYIHKWPPQNRAPSGQTGRAHVQFLPPAVGQYRPSLVPDRGHGQQTSGRQ